MINKKNNLKKSGQMTCEEFRGYRNSYGMSQKEWAVAVGISSGLVKLIETGKNTCSVKTADKVWEFIGSCGAAYRTTGADGLEEHILYDIFIEHMKKMEQKEAASYAAKCIRPLMKSLSKASECNTTDAQKRYFDFLEIFLYTMHVAASEYASMANDGKTVPDIRMELIEFMGEKMKKIRQQEGTDESGGLDGDGQYSLF